MVSDQDQAARTNIEQNSHFMEPQEESEMYPHDGDDNMITPR